MGKTKLLEASDLADCANLYIKVFNQAPWNDGWQYETAFKRLQHIFDTPGFIGMGIDKDERLVGMLCGYKEQWIEEEHYNLIEICIDTDFQWEGLGSRLLQSLETHLAQSDCRQIYLLTMRESTAEAFYKKHGYYVSKRMIMMSKRLAGRQ